MNKDTIKEALLDRATDIQNSSANVKSLNIVVLNGKLCVNNIDYFD
jgi:hypothetical protein